MEVYILLVAYCFTGVLLVSTYFFLILKDKTRPTVKDSLILIFYAPITIFLFFANIIITILLILFIYLISVSVEITEKLLQIVDEVGKK